VAVLKLPPTTLLFQVNGAGLKELRSEWNSACKKAGFPVGRKEDGFTFHNTQHSCLTNLAAEGTPDTVARSISGHSTASMHERYQITQESAKKAALTAMTARVRSTPAGLDEWRKDTTHGHREGTTTSCHWLTPERRAATSTSSLLRV
jgi:hypothetical protein